MNARQYATAINTWAEFNFDYIDRIGWGIVEEIGEYCQAKLKHEQKIRKFNPSPSQEDAMREKLEDQLADAIADTMIFLLHWTHVRGCFVSFGEAATFVEIQKEYNEQLTIGLMLSSLGQIFVINANYEGTDEAGTYRPYAQKLMNLLFMLCKINNFDPMKVLGNTWAEVSKRNWRKYPKNGLTE